MRLPCCAAVAPLIAAAAASAQAARPDSAGRDTIVLAPVTVTAARQARPLLDLPLAVTALSPREWFGGRGTGLDDALGLVPGVLAASRSGGSDVRIVIRGFGARGAGDRSNSGTSRGVRLLLDGFPETEPDGRTSFDQIDLGLAEGVEVVRSNASPAWGNAAGGVVAVSTLPESGPPFALGELQAGAFAQRRAAVRAGTTLGLARLAGGIATTTLGGWREHSDEARTLGTLSLRTPLAAGTALGVYATASRRRFRIPGPLTRAQADSAPRQASAAYVARDERRDNLVGRLGVRLEHEHAPGGGRGGLTASLFVAPKVLRRSERGTFRDFARYHVGAGLEYRAAVRFGGGRGGLVSVGGDAAVQDGAILFYSLAADGSRGDTLRADRREGAGNYGAFFLADLDLGPRLSVALGARLDAVRYDYEDHLEPWLGATRAFRGVTPKLGVTWRLGAAHTLYAAVGGGIESPAGNETSPAPTFGDDTLTGINPLLDAIRSTTWEVGTKHVARVAETGLVRRLSYDVALYTTAVSNEIVPYRGGQFFFTAGRARRRGAEAGLALAAPGGVTIRAALAWHDHRYSDYLVDSVHYGVPGASADYSENRIVGIPDRTYALSLSVAPPALRPLRARLALQAQSDYFADDANRVSVPGYAVLNAMLGADEAVHVGGGWRVRGFVAVSNVFDRAHIASAYLNPEIVGGEPVAFEPGLPRHVVIGVTVGR